MFQFCTYNDLFYITLIGYKFRIEKQVHIEIIAIISISTLQAGILIPATRAFYLSMAMYCKEGSIPRTRPTPDQANLFSAKDLDHAGLGKKLLMRSLSSAEDAPPSYDDLADLGLSEPSAPFPSPPTATSTQPFPVPPPIPVLEPGAGVGARAVAKTGVCAMCERVWSKNGTQ